LKVLKKNLCEERFDLSGRIGLLQEAPTGDKPLSHILGKRATRGVEHRQKGPEPNRLIGNLISTKYQGIEPDIGWQLRLVRR